MSRKIISLVLSLCFIFQQTGFVQAAAVELNLSGYFARMASSMDVDKFRPIHLRYFSYDSLNNSFKVLLDKGTDPKQTEQKLKEETKELLSYFLIGVTLPNDKFWVNLRPDSPSQIIDFNLEETDIGKIMLEADLQLKKDTASFTSPQSPEGKEYWNRLYKKAEEIYGTENITIPTLTRPWIVPNEIIVRETKDSAYIYKATLKVMLEQDYLKDSSAYSFKDSRAKALNEYSSQLIRELIIPKLSKEVNLSKRYAPLRQVYYSLILSRWFKSRFYGKSGVYASLIDKQDLTNLTSKGTWTKSTYFNQYKKSFSDGEYNIKEPVYTPTGQTIRSYFSGGIGWSGGQFSLPGGAMPQVNIGKARFTGVFSGRETNFPGIILNWKNNSIAYAGNPDLKQPLPELEAVPTTPIKGGSAASPVARRTPQEIAKLIIDRIVPFSGKNVDLHLLDKVGQVAKELHPDDQVIYYGIVTINRAQVMPLGKININWDKLKELKDGIIEAPKSASPAQAASPVARRTPQEIAKLIIDRIVPFSGKNVDLHLLDKVGQVAKELHPDDQVIYYGIVTINRAQVMPLGKININWDKLKELKDGIIEAPKSASPAQAASPVELTANLDQLFTELDQLSQVTLFEQEKYQLWAYIKLGNLTGGITNRVGGVGNFTVCNQGDEAIRWQVPHGNLRSALNDLKHRFPLTLEMLKPIIVNWQSLEHSIRALIDDKSRLDWVLKKIQKVQDGTSPESSLDSVGLPGLRAIARSLLDSVSSDVAAEATAPKAGSPLDVEQLGIDIMSSLAANNSVKEEQYNAVKAWLNNIIQKGEFTPRELIVALKAAVLSIEFLESPRFLRQYESDKGFDDFRAGQFLLNHFGLKDRFKDFREMILLFEGIKKDDSLISPEDKALLQEEKLDDSIRGLLTVLTNLVPPKGSMMESDYWKSISATVATLRSFLEQYAMRQSGSPVKQVYDNFLMSFGYACGENKELFTESEMRRVYRYLSDWLFNLVPQKADSDRLSFEDLPLVCEIFSKTVEKFADLGAKIENVDALDNPVSFLDAQLLEAFGKALSLALNDSNMLFEKRRQVSFMVRELISPLLDLHLYPEYKYEPRFRDFYIFSKQLNVIAAALKDATGAAPKSAPSTRSLTLPRSGPAQANEDGGAGSPVLTKDMPYDQAYSIIFNRLNNISHIDDILKEETLTFIAAQEEGPVLLNFVTRLLNDAFKLHNKFEAEGLGYPQAHSIYAFLHEINTGIIGISKKADDVLVEYWNDKGKIVTQILNEDILTFLAEEIIDMAKKYYSKPAPGAAPKAGSPVTGSKEEEILSIFNNLKQPLLEAARKDSGFYPSVSSFIGALTILTMLSPKEKFLAAANALIIALENDAKLSNEYKVGKILSIRNFEHIEIIARDLITEIDNSEHLKRIIGIVKSELDKTIQAPGAAPKAGSPVKKRTPQEIAEAIEQNVTPFVGMDMRSEFANEIYLRMEYLLHREDYDLFDSIVSTVDGNYGYVQLSIDQAKLIKLKSGIAITPAASSPTVGVRPMPRNFALLANLVTKDCKERIRLLTDETIENVSKLMSEGAFVYILRKSNATQAEINRIKEIFNSNSSDPHNYLRFGNGLFLLESVVTGAEISVNKSNSAEDDKIAKMYINRIAKMGSDHSTKLWLEAKTAIHKLLRSNVPLNPKYDNRVYLPRMKNEKVIQLLELAPVYLWHIRSGYISYLKETVNRFSSVESETGREIQDALTSFFNRLVVQYVGGLTPSVAVATAPQAGSSDILDELIDIARTYFTKIKNESYLGTGAKSVNPHFFWRNVLKAINMRESGNATFVKNEKQAYSPSDIFEIERMLTERIDFLQITKDNDSQDLDKDTLQALEGMIKDYRETLEKVRFEAEPLRLRASSAVEIDEQPLKAVAAAIFRLASVDMADSDKVNLRIALNEAKQALEFDDVKSMQKSLEKLRSLETTWKDNEVLVSIISDVIKNIEAQAAQGPASSAVRTKEERQSADYLLSREQWSRFASDIYRRIDESKDPVLGDLQVKRHIKSFIKDILQDGWHRTGLPISSLTSFLKIIINFADVVKQEEVDPIMQYVPGVRHFNDVLKEAGDKTAIELGNEFEGLHNDLKVKDLLEEKIRSIVFKVTIKGKSAAEKYFRAIKNLGEICNYIIKNYVDTALMTASPAVETEEEGIIRRNLDRMEPGEARGALLQLQQELSQNRNKPGFSTADWSRKARPVLIREGLLNPEVKSSTSSPVGGIDFKHRALASATTYEAMGSFAGLDFSLPKLSSSALLSFNLDKEQSDISRAIDNGIIVSGQRIKEFMAASSVKGELEQRRETVITWLAKLGILEETTCCTQESSKEYREALVIADSVVI